MYACRTLPVVANEYLQTLCTGRRTPSAGASILSSLCLAVYTFRKHCFCSLHLPLFFVVLYIIVSVLSSWQPFYNCRKCCLAQHVSLQILSGLFVTCHIRTGWKWNFWGWLETIPPLLLLEKHRTGISWGQASTKTKHIIRGISLPDCTENLCNSTVTGSVIFNSECTADRLLAGLSRDCRWNSTALLKLPSWIWGMGPLQGSPRP